MLCHEPPYTFMRISDNHAITRQGRRQPLLTVTNKNKIRESYHTCTRRREYFKGIWPIIEIRFRNSRYSFRTCKMVDIMSNLFFSKNTITKYLTVNTQKFINIAQGKRSYLPFHGHQIPRHHYPEQLCISLVNRTQLYTCIIPYIKKFDTIFYRKRTKKCGLYTHTLRMYCKDGS